MSRCQLSLTSYTIEVGNGSRRNVLEAPTERDRAALALLHAARGNPGAEDAIVATISVDEQGNHVPPVGTLDEWTRWVFGRLVTLYFQQDERTGPR